MKSLETDLETLEEAMRLLFQTMKRPQHWREVTRRARIDMDRPAAGVLKVVMTCPEPSRVQDIADALGIEAPSVTRKTQELEQAGYLRRSVSKTDRRATDLHVTARGKAVTNKLRKAQREIMAGILKDWDPTKRRQFVEALMQFGEELADTTPGNRRHVSHHVRGTHAR